MLFDYTSLCYTSRTLLFIHSVYNDLHLSSQTPHISFPLAPFLLGNHKSVLCVCYSVSLSWILSFTSYFRFPGSSAGKEYACNAWDPGSIPGSGTSPAEGIGYPLWYSWASLVTQTVKIPPAMWEAWVWSLGWEDALEKGMATLPTPVFLPGEFYVQRSLAGYSPWGCKEWNTT